MDAAELHAKATIAAALIISHVVSIPIPHLELPHFVHDPGGQTVGQGDGEGEEGGGHAGNQPGQHILEAEFTVEELAAMLGEVGITLVGSVRGPADGGVVDWCAVR